MVSQYFFGGTVGEKASLVLSPLSCYPSWFADFVLAFYGMVNVYKYGNYETCCGLQLSYRCAGSAGFRRPSTALSGETNAALPRRSDRHQGRTRSQHDRTACENNWRSLRDNSCCQRCLVGECSVISIIVARIRQSKFTGVNKGFSPDHYLDARS